MGTEELENEYRELESIIRCMEGEVTLAGIGECESLIPESFYDELNAKYERLYEVIEKFGDIYKSAPETLSDEFRQMIEKWENEPDIELPFNE
ncbi:MAG: hypothetical protein MR508_08740 [Lachnospiraceae bacterium]|nr:hypothetical protein [Lachnospiraceae bacterium]